MPPAPAQTKVVGWQGCGFGFKSAPTDSALFAHVQHQSVINDLVAKFGGDFLLQGFDFVAPPIQYCTDNAAMIARVGAERLARGLTSGLDARARPRWPLDEATALSDPLYATGRKGAKA